jgi:hypothetical protein
MLAIQAWGEGHWVVAVGHDAHGITVMDPWLGERTRIDDLAARWHDVEGAAADPLIRYGLAARVGR